MPPTEGVEGTHSMWEKLFQSVGVILYFEIFDNHHISRLIQLIRSIWNYAVVPYVSKVLEQPRHENWETDLHKDTQLKIFNAPELKTNSNGLKIFSWIFSAKFEVLNFETVSTNIFIGHQLEFDPDSYTQIPGSINISYDFLYILLQPLL